MTRPPLSVALVWHMHQPYYRDDVAGLFVLPWVRRRATKDYLHMLRLLEDHPRVRVTMNMVPSLLQQLELYASGSVADADRDLCLRDAGELTAAERAFLIGSALHDDHGRRVRLLTPMMELLNRLRGVDVGDVSESDIRDLQLWTLLAWIDSGDILADPELASLAARGAGFTEADKALVDNRQLALLAEVVPLYRAACARGQVEPMTTPLHHPILPLLVDQSSARVALPSVVLPAPTATAEADAEAQVRRGLAEFHRIVGIEAAGMWPAECAVSPAAAALMARCGVTFALSDEGVLARSGGDGVAVDVRAGDDLYVPHEDRSGLLLVFRDAELSNLVGFSYQSMDAQGAAADLLGRLEQIARNGDGAARLVTIALDGENFKDFYAENGTPFLTELYAGLDASPHLESSTIGAFLGSHRDTARPLPSLWTGSWIDADLSTWIGEPAHTRAWELLAATREALDRAGGGGRYPAAYREILIAEASDWFWWFGSRHDSGSDQAWDALFRTHLRNVHILAGLAVPDELDEPILDGVPLGHSCEPLRSIDPATGGEGEWSSAGIAAVGDVLGAMHPPASSVSQVLYGAGGGRLHLRFGDVMPRFDRAVVDAGPVGRVVVTQAARTLSLAVPVTGELDLSITLEEPGRGAERVPLTGTLRVLVNDGHAPLRVALIAGECAPLVAIGSLADDVASTALDAAAQGDEVVVIIPHHRDAHVGARPGIRLDRLTATRGGAGLVARVLQGRLPGSGVTVLSIDAPVYFDRDRVYGCADDGDRYLAFAALAVALIDASVFLPDVVHAFEWQTAAALAAIAGGGPGPARVFSHGGDSSGFVVPAPAAAAVGAGTVGLDGIDLLDVGRRAAQVVDVRPRHRGLAAMYDEALQHNR